VSETGVAGRHAINPLLTRTKAEAVYDELASRILDGTLVPGSLINQEALAADLGVSITPLREALRRLEAEGLVLLQAHRTLTVAPLSVHEVRELYAVRLRLDPFAAAEAASRASAEALDRIDALAVRETEATTLGRLRTNREFHRAIYRASGNGTLADLLDRLWDQTDRYRLLALQDEQHERGAEQEHRLIAAALRARDRERVEALMYRHVEATLRLVERHADVR
jgi:DNA-binding GntR family transcriptional regulator